MRLSTPLVAFSLLAALAALSLAAPLAAQAEADAQARLLRFPHIQGDKIVFVYAGDLWTASANGGDARRLTSYDEGFELYPRISPDGEWVAFSGEYTGTRQIFVVPYDGGTPKQVTFYPDAGPMPPRGGYDHLPLDWTPDGSRILIRANRTPYGQRIGRYFLVDPFNGGLEKPLKVPEGGSATFSPDGQKLAYNIISREWRTWKRYRAGRAQDVWVYDLAGDQVERITDFDGTDNFPMWLGERIYFTSDRTGTLNLYAYDLASKETRAITDDRGFDALFPSRGNSGIIFQRGGYLHVMDAATEQVRQLRITLADDGPWLRPTWKDGATRIANFTISPSAKRAVVEFRGDLFSAPAEKGEVRPLTRSPHRRERAPRWSPDGKTLAFLAEATEGEDYELYLRDLATGDERQVTADTGAWILSHRWAPTSKHIAWVDKSHRLMVLDVANGSSVEVDRGGHGGIGSVAWSPDGRWLAYVKPGTNSYRSVWLCAAADGTPVRVTTDHYQDSSPTFDPDGKYLYFASARDFQFDGFSFDQRLYALLLQRDAPHPLAPLSDEEAALASADASDADETGDEGADEESDPDQHDKTAAATGDDAPAAAAIEIDLDRLTERLVALPLPADSYRSLTGVPGGLLFVGDGKLQRYDLERREADTVLDAPARYALTPDHKHLVYQHRGKLCLAKPSKGQKLGDGAMPLDGVRVRVTPRDEWAQMYTDAWRLMRDWFYDPDMHGVDWKAMRAKYEPLLAHVSHRADLDFLLGELIGELNCGHTYVQAGETPSVSRVRVGLLGCEFKQQGEHYQIATIFPGENWNERTRCPLREPGVDARKDDFVLSIDGVPLKAPTNPYALLEGTVGRHIELELNTTPTAEGARRVTVRPVASEQGMRYLAWVQRNRRLVAQLSEGRIGYVHVPNTAIDGHRELFEGFRPQARAQEAMIIDDRYNGGGWIPDRMVFALGQPVLNYWSRRHEDLSPTPTFAFEGPMAMLINGYSSSGGDAFPYYFKKTNRGKLIGQRTWGGLVGYSGTPQLVDGGGLAVPSFAFVNTDGEWDVEAVGVAPDIEVFDDPAKIVAGQEPILKAAVDHLLGQLGEAAPKPKPPTPRGPRRDKASVEAAATGG
ncbi:MAG: S41 family peptidase [Planctomycetota bacterium]